MNFRTRLSLARKVLFDVPTRPTMREVKRRFRGPIVGAEIGVFKGLNSLDILNCIPNIERIYLVDPYEYFTDKWDYESEYLKAAKMIAKKNLEAYSSKIVWIQDAFSADAIPEPLDFAYIDGDHSYEGVMRDIEEAERGVRLGGIIGGHDIGFPGVLRAVEETYGPVYKRRMSDWYVVKTSEAMGRPVGYGSMPEEAQTQKVYSA